MQPGVFAREGSSSAYPVHIPSLIGIAGRLRDGDPRLRRAHHGERGGETCDTSQGDPAEEYERSRQDAKDHQQPRPIEEVLIWPFDAEASGLSTVMRDAGTMIMFAGTPYAHLHICGDPWRATNITLATKPCGR